MMPYVLILAISILALSLMREARAADKPVNLKEQMRALWAPAAGEYVRTWLVCGEFPIPASDDDDSGTPQPLTGFANDFLQGHGGEKGIRPVAGAAHTRADGTLATWTKYTSASDTILYTGAFVDHPTDNVVWYAATTIQRTKVGKMVFALDSQDAVKVWLNGVLVHEHYLAREVGYGDMFEVPLHAGENVVLIKVLQRSPGYFAFRMLERPQAEALELTNTRLSPILAPTEEAGQLTVVTDDSRSNLLPNKPQVEVVVSAPGGRTMASKTASRGEKVTFDTAEWPVGPYEITVSMNGVAGKRHHAYLSWFNGDAHDMLKELVSTAPTPDDRTPNGMTHTLLADLVKDRLGADVGSAKNELLPLAYPALMEYAELQQRCAERPNGFVRLAYRDDVDDSPQFCRVYLPPNYQPYRKYPLVISLHGRVDEFPSYIHWWGVDQRHDGIADGYQAIVAYPHARGNSWFRGMGDKDVMHCLELLKQRFPIDENRVYLMGYSMGGAGTWYVGTRHPEQFAAIAPFFGGYDFRFQLTDAALNALTVKEQYRRERLSYIAQAESLRTTPVLASHGDADTTVPIDYSRYTLRMMQRWGYDVRYWEKPGKGHEDLGNNTEVLDWLFAHKRVANPTHVSLRSADLRYAQAHWVRIEQRKDPYAFMQAEAEVIAPNYIRLNTDNVLQITLAPKTLIDSDKPVQVLWNNTEMRTVTFTNGVATLLAKGYVPPKLCKRPELEGPANDIYNTPFAIVVGTISPDPLMRRMCERAGLRLLAWWDERFHTKPRYFKDTEISPEDQANYSLLLIGGPADNQVTGALADRIPLKIAANAISIDGHAFPARDAAVQMCYPNPLNPDRYVLIRAASSPTGMFFSENVLNDVDFCIVDSHSADPAKSAGFFDAITGRNGGPPIAAGYFDNGWHYQEASVERWTFADETKYAKWSVPQYASAAVKADRVMLADVIETKAEGAFMDMFRDRSFAGKVMNLGWKRYGSGIAVAPKYWLPKQPCAAEFDLSGGKWNHLRATIGLELPAADSVTPEVLAKALVEFVVKGDGLELYHSEPFTFTTAPKQIDVKITGVNTLRLELIDKTLNTNPAKSINWADIRLER